MRRSRRIILAAAAIALFAATAACGAKPEKAEDDGSAKGAMPYVTAEANASGEDGTAPDAAVYDGGNANAGRSPEAEAIGLDPAAARVLLEEAGIPNGDIYIGDGGLLHINIVGLNEEIERRFAETFPNTSYKLVDVRYTYEELERAQEALIKHDLMRKLNLYSSSIDVIGNRIEITMPDSSNGAQAEIEKYIDPGMIAYHIEPLGEPHVVGQIVEIDEAGQRLLILVDGEQEPSYWLSFDEFSDMTAASGGEIGFDAFEEGQAVRVWTAGAVMTSMPAQARVRRIEAAE